MVPRRSAEQVSALVGRSGGTDAQWAGDVASGVHQPLCPLACLAPAAVACRQNPIPTFVCVDDAMPWNPVCIPLPANAPKRSSLFEQLVIVLPLLQITEQFARSVAECIGAEYDPAAPAEEHTLPADDEKDDLVDHEREVEGEADPSSHVHSDPVAV